MSFSPEYARSTEEKAQNIISLIVTVLVPYFREHQWIPEWLYLYVFPELVSDDSDCTGKPLNEKATNRQRFLVDNGACWQKELADRRAATLAAEEAKELKRVEKALADAARPLKVRQCAQLGCGSEIDITTSVLKKINEATWKKCQGKNCSLWTCPDHFEQIKQHELTCSKIVGG